MTAKKKFNFKAPLEVFAKSIVQPMMYLSVAGILLIVGIILTNKTICALVPVLGSGPFQLVGAVVYQSLMFIINNLSILFCVGIAGAMAKKNKGHASLIALMSFFLFLQANNIVLNATGSLADASGMLGLTGTGQATVMGIQVLDTGVFGGIILGCITGAVFNKYSNKQFPIALSMFSGVRFPFLIMIIISWIMGAGFCIVWPPVQGAISSVAGIIKESGNIGLFIYGMLNKLLVPTGLHHLIYTPFQFSALGNSLTVGDATYTGSYIVMMMEYSMGLPFSDGIVWMYTGFTKTFGYFGIVAAFIFCARKENRKKTAAQLLPLAFTASLASITEPLDFLFCFSAPVLWLAHAVISGIFIVLLHLCHITAFTSNLLGSLLMNLSAGTARTNYPVLYLLGLAEIAVYFVVFTALIRWLDLPTPGRRPEEPARPEAPLTAADIEKLIAALGGRGNIRTVDNCFTRLRITVQEAAFVDAQALHELPCSGVVLNGCEVQLVYGLQAAQVRQAVEERLGRVVC